MTITNYTADTWPLLLKSLYVLNLFLFLEITYFSITNVQKKKKKKKKKKERKKPSTDYTIEMEELKLFLSLGSFA